MGARTFSEAAWMGARTFAKRLRDGKPFLKRAKRLRNVCAMGARKVFGKVADGCESFREGLRDGPAKTFLKRAGWVQTFS